jgi:tRNA pseudouridine38-40 synthase
MAEHPTTEKRTARDLQRFALVLEFEGTGYRGWQKQGEQAVKTVQGVILARAAELFATDKIELQGNGRTDAGVHALEYTAHLTVRTRLTAPEIKAGLNRLLPKDIAILTLRPVDARFHARHHCLGRSYLYQIAEEQRAFMRRYAWSLEDELDLGLMRQAAALFVGMHDFAAFAEKQELKKSTKVLVHALRLEQAGGMILVRVVASHFLWHLVRRLVGTMAAIGSGKLTLGEAKEMLATGKIDSIPWLAPAHGLFFEKAFYEPEEFASFAETAPLITAPRSSAAGFPAQPL